MSRCSKKCNEIKGMVDSISGLEDNYVYDWLKRLENVTEAIVDIISNYADRNELNGTCFNQNEKPIDKIDILLMEHNIMPGKLGFHYIKWILLNETKTISRALLYELYKKISIEFNCTPSSVERAIRYSFEHSTLNENKSNKTSLSMLQLKYRRFKYEN